MPTTASATWAMPTTAMATLVGPDMRSYFLPEIVYLWELCLLKGANDLSALLMPIVATPGSQNFGSFNTASGVSGNYISPDGVSTFFPIAAPPTVVPEEAAAPTLSDVSYLPALVPYLRNLVCHPGFLHEAIRSTSFIGDSNCWPVLVLANNPWVFKGTFVSVTLS